MSFKQLLTILFKKSQTLCKNLNRSQKFFFFGTILIFPTLVFYILSMSKASIAFICFSFLLLLFGIISDLLLLYGKVWDTFIGKGIILISYAMCTTISYAFASQLVNDVIAFDSSKLTNSITFTSILLIPVFILGFSFLLFIGIFIFGQFYLIIASTLENLKDDECFNLMTIAPKECYPKATFISRLIIYPLVIGSFLSFGSDMMPAYGKRVESWTKWFIYNLEAVKHSRCEIKNNDSKVIVINENEIVIATKNNDSYMFTPAICIPRIKSNTIDKQQNK